MTSLMMETLLQLSEYLHSLTVNLVHVLNCNLATVVGMKTPSHIFCPFMGSLNQPDFSLTFLNLTHIATSTSSVEQIFSYIHSSPASASWPTKSFIYSILGKFRQRGRSTLLKKLPRLWSVAPNFTVYLEELPLSINIDLLL